VKTNKRLIAQAARATGRRRLAEYVLTAALERAKTDLTDQAVITLKRREFSRFLARLDEPPRFLPGLRALLDQPAEFEPALPQGC